jgi:glycosyltransferase involved in cell wall biosynthesis
MRILFVHEIFGSFGGAESNVLASAYALRRRGHTVGLLAWKPSSRGEPAWHELFAGNLFWRSGEPAGLVARRFGADAVYVHKWSEVAGIESLLKGGVPLVRMVHDHDMYCLRSYRYNPLNRHICTRPAGMQCIFPCLAPLQRNRAGGLPVRWLSFREKQLELALSRRFDRNIVATEFMRHELLINGFEGDRIRVCAPVPTPADPLTSSFSDRNLLIYAGQLVRGKGVDVLLRALAKVRARFEVIILGEGGHRAACERLCNRLGLQDRVTFKGYIPQAELREYHRDATAVLVPSVWPEPMGLVGLEAMRNGLPVVAFDAGGVRDWLRDGENGFVAPWMDVEGYAEKIDVLLADKELARTMGRRGFERFVRDYDFDRYIGKLEEILEGVALERGKIA